MTDAATQRSRLGLLCAGFGVILLAPLAMAWLSSHGPNPLVLSGAAWSRIYYAEFIALVVIGYGYILSVTAKRRVFHAGPMADFSIGMAGVMIAYGFGRGWVPGVFLMIFGLRLATGKALLP